MEDIEPRIRPLVEALNETGLVRTFSSCEGHFGPKEQTLVDRNHAEVRFVPAEGVTQAAVVKLVGSILTRFKSRHGLIPVNVTAFKLFTPIDEETVEQTFVLVLRPFNRFDSPDRKRADVDRAIEQVIQLIL
ncbi:hypothetical protein [Spirosoma fluviale]|uniref:Uncharacterized protein n=1 Tax=Spirosoma fluviale TaxID=1597977 RepID=A0A286FC00_9BACT|nr:hypothetical protein [Spirosoma fluviale]SOD80713.1 hypothetical protein SAMN06269250_1540 [Spirosoma fluviale]